MTYDKVHDAVVSMIADGFITAYIEKREFWQTVREALEKQIPKEVILFECDPGNLWKTRRYVCPSCNKTLHGKNDYCEKCGQALEWENT